MKSLKRKYIVNKHNEKVAVQLDIKTFEKIEWLLEDPLLGNIISENRITGGLSVAEAKTFYLNHKGSKTQRNTKR